MSSDGFQRGLMVANNQADRAIRKWESYCKDLKSQLANALQQANAWKAKSQDWERHANTLAQAKAEQDQTLQQMAVEQERLQKRIECLEANNKKLVDDFHVVNGSVLALEKQRQAFKEEIMSCPENTGKPGSHHKIIQDGTAKNIFLRTISEYAAAHGYRFNEKDRTFIDCKALSDAQSNPAEPDSTL